MFVRTLAFHSTYAAPACRILSAGRLVVCVAVRPQES